MISLAVERPRSVLVDARWDSLNKVRGVGGARFDW
jgi:hypothetical protein